jgi:hypothetical protein
MRTGKIARNTAVVCAGLALALTAPFAAAQSQGGVVRGNTKINVNAENVNTIAVGSGNTAKTSIGSVKGGTRESSTVTVDVKNVSNVVVGRGRKGCVNIGTKGADPDCN